MPRLSVNIDHVATVREARKTFEPEPVAAAVMAQLGGADGIIVHLREDRRHIQDRDVYLLKEVVSTKLNLEMAATDEIVRIALNVKPDMATLVPERREELTTEGGLDVAGNLSRIAETVSTLKRGGIRVSLFVDPSLDQVAAAKRAGADIIEIHTGAYAEAGSEAEAEQRFRDAAVAARKAYTLGLRVAVGHGLTYHNVKRFTRIPEIEEFSIGHSIISRAVLVGLERAVRDMAALLKD